MNIYQQVSQYTSLTEEQLISLCSFFKLLPKDKTLVIAGTYKGGDAMAARLLIPNANIVVIDSFQGLAQPAPEDQPEHGRTGRFACPVDEYLAGFKAMNIISPDKIYQQFITNESIKEVKVHDLGLLWMDLDHYLPTKVVLSYFWPQITKETIVITHDYGFWHTPGVKIACDEFYNKVIHKDGITQLILGDNSETISKSR
jgi:hypothetical protein